MENPKDINTTVLAYMGDAVYEQAVREHIIRKRPYDANWLHRTATAFVKAQAQAEIIKTMFDELSFSPMMFGCPANSFTVAGSSDTFTCTGIL